MAFIKGKQLANTLRSESDPFDVIYSDRVLGDLNGAIRFTAVNNVTSATNEDTIGAYKVVYITGQSGNLPTIGLADADSSSMPAFGLTVKSSDYQQEVDVITFGNLKGVDTSSLSVGDVLYVSTTPGEYTTIPPAGTGSKIQNIGMVVKSDSNGIIKVGGAGRSNATPNLDQGKFFLGNSSNQSVQSVYTLPTTIGAQGTVLTSNGSSGVTFETIETGAPAPTVIQASQFASSTSVLGITGNTEYVVSRDITHDIYLRVPLTANGLGDTIKIRNTTDYSVIIERYTVNSSSLYPLRYWNGDLVPLLGSSTPLSRYRQLTIEGKGEITIINQSASSVDWWVHHSPAVEWEIDSINTNGALFYDSTKRAVSILGKFDPPYVELTGNVSGSSVRPVTYYTNYDHGDDAADVDYTVSLPSRISHETAVQELATAGFFFIENRGSKLVNLTLVNPYPPSVNHNNNNYSRAYLRDMDGNSIGSLVIYPGEKYKIETKESSFVSGSNTFYDANYYAINFPQDTRRVIDSTASNATITSQRERELIYIVKNGSTAVTLTLPSVITDTSSSARKAGYQIRIKKTGTGTVTIQPSSGDLIDGQSSIALDTDYQSVTLTSDTTASTGWWTVSPQSSEGGGYTFSTISSATTAQTGYHYSCNTSASAFTLTLPALSNATAGQEIRVKLATAGNDLTIAPSASDTIEGSSNNYVLSIAKSAITLVANVAGTDWEII